MSFKTSVLIWFSRFRGSQPHPKLTGWGFCIRQKNMGFRDIMPKRHSFFNDIGFEDRGTDEYKMLVTEF